MLEWVKLLNPDRRKELHGSTEVLGTSAGRSEFERDYDRILFATPTRRLADKTQVYPMEENDSVRTRLTHSHEVSNLARGIGVRLAFDHAEAVFGSDHEALHVKRIVPAVLAAAGLAHDLGNPPFGHQGELAIQQWFQERLPGKGLAVDFLKFDGNAQTFRLLTRLQVLNDTYGYNLTIGTLATLVKYPSVYGSPDMGGFKKFGIFASEEQIVKEVWSQTGLGHGVRHPLAYIVEACDDIAYSVIDAEDTVKKGYASFYDLMDFLEAAGTDDPTIASVLDFSRKTNAKFRKEKLSSRELNDISMQMFRVKAIADMIEATTTQFVAKVSEMRSGEIESGFALIASSPCARLCQAAKEFDGEYGFRHKDVLRLELQGNQLIKGMMDIAWSSIANHERLDKPLDRYVFGEISENYRRVYSASDKELYARCQLLCDAVAGMTESHLRKRFREYHALGNAVSQS